MKYGDTTLNLIQVSRIIDQFFNDHFDAIDNGVQLESYIAKNMEDTDNEFLMYCEKDIANHIKFHKRMIKELKHLQGRDFSTKKFKDIFYYEK